MPIICDVDTDEELLTGVADIGEATLNFVSVNHARNIATIRDREKMILEKLCC
jgi:hypothetical protein